MTAVDYLFDRHSTLYLFKDALLAKKALEEAKKMEKQQIVDANYSGKSEGGVSTHEADEYMQSAQDYYNQTYKP